MIFFQNIARMISVAALQAIDEHKDTCDKCQLAGVLDCPLALDLLRVASGSACYLPVLVKDLCEWDPERNAPAMVDESGRRISSCHNVARYELGDKVTFRVCSACILLERFAGRAKRSIPAEAASPTSPSH